MSTRKKRDKQKFLNSVEAAKYLGISRQYFYILQRKHQLKPYARDGIICQWSLNQLATIKQYLKNPIS